MNTIVIDYESAKALLGEAVAEKGENYVYQYPKVLTVGGLADTGTCVYLDETGCPSCIVGNALMRAGVPTAALRMLDLDNTTAGEGEFEHILGSFDVRLSGSALQLLSHVQIRQDNLKAWGYALNETIKELES